MARHASRARTAAASAPTVVHRKPSPDQLRAMTQPSSRGSPLPGGVRSQFERGFDHDFSQVRVHTDGEADTSARALDARAFTMGQNLSFRRGEYALDTVAGRRLLAHELAHVVQQGRRSSLVPGVSEPGDAAEVEADRAAESVVTEGRSGRIGALPAMVSREPAGERSPPTYIEFEIEPGGPPGQITLRSIGPTDNAKWVERSMIAAGYTIWLRGYMLYIEGMTIGGAGIIVPESDVDFTIERTTPINQRIYDSRTEARTAVAAAAKPADASHPIAYYWGAGGLVVVPTVICPGSAPKTAATMLQARMDYAYFVQRALGGLAVSMVIGKTLGGLYRWARGGGGGGKAEQIAPPPNAQSGKSEPSKLPANAAPLEKAPAKPATRELKVARPESPKTTTNTAEADLPKSGPDLFQRTAQTPGGQAAKASYFESQAAGLKQRTGWEANYTGQSADGARVYHGEAQAKALVITSDGRVMTGSWGKHVKLQVGPSGPELVCDWNLPGWKQW
jgi:hypothetical protein